MDANVNLWINVFVLLAGVGGLFYVSLFRHMD